MDLLHNIKRGKLIFKHFGIQNISLLWKRYRFLFVYTKKKSGVGESPPIIVTILTKACPWIAETNQGLYLHE